ncbi:MAG: YkgJ family cysteine cluster protein [Planctomycetaceae bacterium]|jgi:Fe-S-cluster containining protein|nr:YkgJ family cysteine cluster protein [Planctomycetaceae bacterium]
MSKKSLWYSEGLQFECQACGSCCGGGPGFVWVTQDEIDQIAVKFGIESELFEKLFVWTICEGELKGRRSLKEYPNGDCVLLDETTRTCKFYEVRPIQCRTWPFWAQNIVRKDFWDAISKRCPGCNRGRLYSLEEIEERRDAFEL